MLTLDAVSRRFGAVAAVNDVTLEVADGEFLCLVGPSGSGKSTLLRLAAGLERVSTGRIVLDGVEVDGPGRFVETEHRRVGMVFQDYALFPHLTVAANVAYGLRGRPRAAAAGLARDLLTRLGLAGLASSYPHTLSGGERQRVALARAIAPGPRLLLMDEPFSSLDSRLRDDVRQHTLRFLRETGTTTILVTHDPDEALRVADRVALLRAGRLEQCGGADELYAHPATLFAARFFSEVNELRSVCRQGRVDTPLGTFPAPHLASGSPVSVCIRPQHLHLTARPSGHCARVLATDFLGEIDQVEIEVDGLVDPLRLRAFGRTGLRPNDHVHVDVSQDHALVVPAE